MNAASLDESKGDGQQLSNLDHLWLSIRDMDDTAKSRRHTVQIRHERKKPLCTATLRLFIPSPCRESTASIRL